MKTPQILFLSLFLLAAAQPAQGAEDPDVLPTVEPEAEREAEDLSLLGLGVYVKLGLSFNTLFQADIDQTGPGARQNGTGKYGLGYGYTGAVGYRVTDALSLELEFTYNRTALRSYRSGGQVVARDGDYASAMLALNVIYRFDLGLPLRPYIGAGFGWVEEIDLDIERFGQQEQGYDDSAWGYQALLGVEWRTELGVFLYAEGRFWGAFGHSLDGENAASGTIDAPYNGVALRFGIGLDF